MRLVLVCGKFDPLHQGHIEHIIKASKLGFLLVVTHSDIVIAKQKGYCAIPFEYRKMILEGLLLKLNIKGVVILPYDTDGTVSETIRRVRPDILAKGGDRTPDNMPQSELDACNEVGCEIIYGVGETLNSSSRIMGR
jgi:cytidyltransferase-like protein